VCGEAGTCMQRRHEQEYKRPSTLGDQSRRESPKNNIVKGEALAGATLPGRTAERRERGGASLKAITVKGGKGVRKEKERRAGFFGSTPANNPRNFSVEEI